MGSSAGSAPLPVNRGSSSAGGDGADGHRRRLLDALADATEEYGYANVTVTDIVRRARTSRRTFYQHFTDKDTCMSALLSEAFAEVLTRVTAAVDHQAPPPTQLRQAIEAWIATTDSQPAWTVSLIRESATLGRSQRRLHREANESLTAVLQGIASGAQTSGADSESAARLRAIMLVGGLQELATRTIEGDRRLVDIRAEIVDACIEFAFGPAAAPTHSVHRGHW